MAVKFAFEVFFDGERISEICAEVAEDCHEREALARCIAKAGLDPCSSVSVRDRCPTRGGLHAHIPARMFCATDPETRGGRTYWTATIPAVGKVSYSFESRNPMPPPVTFRAVAPKNDLPRPAS